MGTYEMTIATRSPRFGTVRRLCSNFNALAIICFCLVVALWTAPHHGVLNLRMETSRRLAFVETERLQPHGDCISQPALKEASSRPELRKCFTSVPQLNAQTQSGNYTLLMVAIFRRERTNLVPWISHYVAEGVDHFALVDNNIARYADESCELAAFIQAGVVSLIKNSRDYIQSDLPAILKPFILRSKWVIHVDLDEYVYARNKGSNPSHTIVEYLSNVPRHISVVAILRKMFGTKSISRNVYPINVQTRRGRLFGEAHKKWIARSSDLETFGPHTVEVGEHVSNRDCTFALPDFTCVGGGPFAHVTEQSLANHSLHLNHYPLGSLQYFSSSKMSRGSASTPLHAHVRNWSYFNSYNKSAHDVEDSELKEKRRKYLYDDGVVKDRLLCNVRHAGGSTPPWCFIPKQEQTLEQGQSPEHEQ
jgi:hypothetical protein